MSEHSELTERLKVGLEAAIGASVRLDSVAPMHGGACQDNLAISFTVSAGGDAGDYRMVLRGDAPSSLPQSLSRRQEFEVIQAATKARVRTPQARWLMRDVTRPGAWSYCLDRIEGDAIGRKILSDPRLESGRAVLVDELSEILARIHTVTPEGHPDLPIEGSDPLAAVESWLRPLP